LSLLVLSALQHSTCEHCLQILGLIIRRVTWNQFPF